MNLQRRLDALEETNIRENNRDYSKLRALRISLNSGEFETDSPLENDLILLENKYLANTELSILRSLVPQANIENITFETIRSSDEKGILVKIVYSISDVVEKDTISQWFDQQEYEKYFQVKTNLWLFKKGTFGSSYDRKIESLETPALDSYAVTAGELLDVDTESNVTKFKFEKVYKLEEEPYGMDFEVITSFDVMQLELDYDIEFISSQYGTELRKKVTILNGGTVQYPIQDFRIREELKGFTLDDSRREDFEFLLQDVRKKRNIDRDNSKDFFSDFWVTRNAQGEAKFIFIFDIESFLKKQSQYKEFYKRMNLMERKTVRKGIDIPSIKIKRKRVKVLEDKHGRHVIDFKDQYTLETVVETCKYKNRSNIKKVITDKGSIMEINISGTSNKDLMFLTGTDYQMSEITDGIYAYGVSVEIIDTTRQLLMKKIQKFNEEINKIKKILNDSLLPKNYDARNNLYKKPIRKTTEESFASLQNKVTDMYNIFVKPLVYRNSDDVIILRERRLKNKIRKLFNLNSVRSPVELEMLIEIMESLFRTATSAIGEPASRFVGKKDSRSSDPRITSEKYYTSAEKVFDSNVPKLQGIDYLYNVEEQDLSEAQKELLTLTKDTGDVGVKVIDGAQWESRTDQEIGRFFPTGTTSINFPELSSNPSADTSVSLTGEGSEFLTMSLFSDPTRQSPLSFLGSTNASSSSDIIRRNILSAAAFRTVPGVPRILASEDREELMFFSQYGVTFEDDVDKLSVLGQDSGVRFSGTRNASPDNDVEVNLVEEFEEDVERRNFEEFVFSKMSEPLSNPMLGSISMFNETEFGLSLNNIENFRENVDIFSRDMSEEVRQAPNQVLSYSLATATPSIDTGRSAVVTQGFLTKIEYLSGFNSDEQDENVNSPIWKSMTIDAYKSNANRNLLCRITPFQRESSGIRITKTNHPIYDSFFVIKPVGNFTYEYTESFEEEFVELGARIREERAELLRYELQELVGEKRMLELIERPLKERALETIFEPQLVIIRNPNNYRWAGPYSDYQLSANRAIREYESSGLRGFALRYRSSVTEVSIGRLQLSDDGGWSSPQNRVNMLDSNSEARELLEQIREIEDRIVFDLTKEIRDKKEQIEEEGYLYEVEEAEGGRPVVIVRPRRGRNDPANY